MIPCHAYFCVLLSCSRKYAAHCTIIASRFALPAFNHPSPIPVKCNGVNNRLRVGYVSPVIHERPSIYFVFVHVSI